MAYQIIPYRREHQELVNALIISIQAQEFLIPITLEEQTDLFDVNGFYRHGSGDFWVALAENQVVGTVALRDLGQPRRTAKDVRTRGPSRRGEGRARLLLERLLRESIERGLKEIFLGTTDAFRAAHRFYEKSGFTEISPNELPSAFPRMVQDTKYYRMNLQLYSAIAAAALRKSHTLNSSPPYSG